MKKSFLLHILLQIFFCINLSAQINLRATYCSNLYAEFIHTNAIADIDFNIVLEKKITDNVWASTNRSYKKSKITFLNLLPGTYRVKSLNYNGVAPFNEADIVISNEIVIGQCETTIYNPNDQVDLFPNPASKEVQITVPINKIDYNLSVYDVLGNIIIYTNILEDTISLPLNGLPSGFYYVVLEKNSIQFAIKKLILR